MLILDGSAGGGQILRTALTLSMVTGQPFHIDHLRANRTKPGLLRRHLASVSAARTICHATVTGADLLSQQLAFAPGPVEAGAYAFTTGIAGATGSVFQTVFPALLRSNTPSTLVFVGTTHVAGAPSFDCLDRTYLPLLRRMGANVTASLERHGFDPAAGGRWRVDIVPGALSTPLAIDTAGPTVSRRIRAKVANIPFDVAQRGARTAADLLGWPDETIEAHSVKADGPGNVIMIEIASEAVIENFTAYGERGRAAELVAADAVEQVRAHLASGAPVGPHLADQLLVPMALVGDGIVVTSKPTPHTRSNIAVIEKFLPVEFEVADIGHGRWRIAVTR